MSQADLADGGYPLDWRRLEPPARWMWWQRLWEDSVRLRDRYRLSLRSGWWEDDIQVETLAALAAWSTAYDAGAWTDPPGKLQLLYDLDRIRALLNAGEDVFDPARDEAAFTEHLAFLGCTAAQ